MAWRTVEVIFRARDQQLRSVLTTSGLQVETWARKVEAAGASSSKTGLHMQQALVTGAVAVAGAFVYGTAKSIAFEKAMRNVNSLSHLSEASLKSLSAQVLQLSTTLPTSAQDLAEGLYDIASSGFQGAQGMTILKSAAEAASAGMSTTETSAKAIVAVLNAYGLSASDAADVSDVLFQTVNYGVLSFDELAHNIGDFVAAGAAAKIPIDQLGAALATMTLSGISGAESSTSLNQVISKLVKPSKALAALYKELGYRSGSAALAQKGLRGVMEDIRHATGGQIDQLLVLFPEIRAARGALALMTNDGRNYAKVSAEIANKDARRGATLRTLHEQMKAAGNQLTVFKNQLDASLIRGATMALPALIALMHAAQDGSAAIARVAAEIGQALGPTWDALRSIGQDAGNIGMDLIHAFGPLVQLLATLSVGGAVMALNALSTVLALVTHLLADNETVTATLVAMWGVRLVAAAIAAAGGIGALIETRVILPIWYAMTGASNALSSALNRQALAAKAANVGLTAVVAYALVEGIQSFQKIATAGDDARESVSGIYQQIGDVPNLDSLRQAAADIAKLKGQVKDPGKGSPFDFLTKGLKGAADVKAARASLDEYTGAQKRVAEQTLRMTRNLTQLQQATGLSQGALQRIADTAKIDLSGGFVSAYNAVTSYQSAVASGKDTATQARLVKALGDIADSAGDAQKKIDGLKDALDALMGGQLGLNEATRNWEQGFADLTKTLGKARGNLNLTTEAGRNNSQALDGQATALKDLVVAQANAGATGGKLNKTWDDGVARLVATMHAAHFTDAQIRTYTQSLGLVPGNVETIVNAAGADSSAAKVKALNAEIARLRSKTITVTATTINLTRNIVTNQAGKKVVGARYEAHGDIITERYAAGGIRPLPKEAMVARNGAALVHWAEPGTGGEAFIPLAPSRRARSEQILARVAEQFGLKLESYAGGGYVNGRWVGTGSPTPLQRAREAERQRKAAAAARTAAAKKAAAAREDQRYSLDLGGVSSTSLTRADGLAGYSHQLSTSIALTNRWRRELVKIASVAGNDVAKQLAEMGDQGVDLVHKMATGTGHAMITIANQLRSLKTSGAINDFVMTMRAGTKETTDFQNNLLKLVGRGYAGLAGQLQAMGVDEGGAIAAAAAGAIPSTLSSIAKAAAANQAASDPTLMQAITLAGLLSSGGGKLGIVGLAAKSGMDVGDVYGLLTRYRSNVFGKLPGASMTTINRDLALVASGKSPTGLQAGGIVSGAATGRGLYYRWAEPGSGGESLIPHGSAHRSRALALWEETGQILGAGRSGRSRGVMVAPGAVQLSLRVDGSQLSEQALTRVARAAATQAMDELADQLGKV